MPIPNVPGKLKYTNQGGVVFGDTLANNCILEEGWLAINTDTDELHIHDGRSLGGVTKLSPAGGVFIPSYSGEVPQTATLAILPAVAQRVALPTGNAFRLTWEGFGPFAYRQGDSNVAAVSTDARATVGYDQIIMKVGTSTHISVYGIGAGTLYIEGGSI